MTHSSRVANQVEMIDLVLEEQSKMRERGGGETEKEESESNESEEKNERR